LRLHLRSDTRDRHFHIVTVGLEDERVASFRTFEELLLRVFRVQVAELMSTVGFQRVRRVDERFFQHVLVGTR